MTPDKTPTDDEIATLYSQETGFLLKESNAAILDFARAVLAKRGSPVVAVEPVAWADERAISWLENSRSRHATVTTQLAKEKSAIRPMPLFNTPQPTQAQAGAVDDTALIQQLVEALVLNNAEWKSLADSGDSGFWKAEEQDHYKQTEAAITASRARLKETP